MIKKFSYFFAGLALCAGMFFQPLWAGEKHGLKISVSSLVNTQAKVSALAEQIDPSLTLVLSMGFAQTALWGVDLTQPFGLVADLTDDEEFAFVAFIPTKNQKMFEAQIAQLRENGQLAETIEVENKDGYSLLLSGMKWEDEIPAFDNSRLLTVKLAPDVLIPILPALAQFAEDMDVDKVAEQIGQIADVELSLDITPDSDVNIQYVGEVKPNTEAAANLANWEKLTTSTLCGFYDANADCAGQILGTFDENNRRDFVRSVALHWNLPQELSDAILCATDVKKIDVAFSFNSSENGICGVYAMGIANGEEINARIEKAIQEMNERPADEKMFEDSAGKINVRKNKNLNFHEITFNNTRLLVAVHAKYLFVSVTTDGSDPYRLLAPRLKDLKKGVVKKNVVCHFDMNLFKTAFPDADFELLGSVKYVVDCEDGKIFGKYSANKELFQTLGKLKSMWGVQSDDSDEIFGDDDEYDDDDE